MKGAEKRKPTTEANHACCAGSDSWLMMMTCIIQRTMLSLIAPWNWVTIRLQKPVRQGEFSAGPSCSIGWTMGWVSVISLERRHDYYLHGAGPRKEHTRRKNTISEWGSAR